MQNVICVEVVNILPGDYIDLLVPLFIQIVQRIKLTLLFCCKMREIFQNDFGAHGTG